MHPKDPYKPKQPLSEMDFFQGRLFFPNDVQKKTWWERYFLASLIGLFGLNILSFNFLPEAITTYILLIVFGWFIVGWIKTFQYVHQIEPLDGKLGNLIRIHKHIIEYGDRIFQLHEIENIKLEITDYYGREIHMITLRNFCLRPNNSQGTGNQIRLVLKNGEILDNYFQIETEKEKNYLRPFLVNCVRSGVMTVSHAALNLGIYGEWEPMQELKREVGKPLG